MTPLWRRRLSAALRYGICIAAIAWLATHTQWDELQAVASSAREHWALLAASVLAFGPAPVLIAVRLKLILAVHQIHLTVWQAIRVTFAGNFIINSLPVGTYGGDAVKAFYVARDTPHKYEAVTSVFFDRVIGVTGLVGMSGIVVVLNWDNPALASWGQTIAVIIIVLGVLGGSFFSRRMRKLVRHEQIVARLPLSSHLQRIDQAAFAFRHRGRRLVSCLALTAVLQGASVISLFLAGWALGVVGDRPLASLPVYFAYVPICFLAGALPFGVMEATCVTLFSHAAQLGTEEAAVSLMLLCRVTQLIWSLPGAAVVLKTGRPPAIEDDLATEPEPGLEAPS